MSNNDEIPLSEVEKLLAQPPDTGRYEDSTIAKVIEQVLQEKEYREALHAPKK
jgi:hypothetical protein